MNGDQVNLFCFPHAGQTLHMVRLLLYTVKYHILALPRIQLREIALSRPVDYISECES